MKILSSRPDCAGTHFSRLRLHPIALLLACVVLSACNLASAPAIPAPAAAGSGRTLATTVATQTPPPAAIAQTPAATQAPAASPAPATAVSAATLSPATASSPPPLPAGIHQPVMISGTFTYTNDIITDYYVEHAVALLDMTGFVRRDPRWITPVESQVLGPLHLDTQRKSGDFTLELPEQPRGTLNDVDHDGKQERGVQIFAVAYAPNLMGGPFAEGDDKDRGWPDYLASTVNDTQNHNEVVGGKLVVWAPDATQHFPTGFGADGRLFTGDDPEGPLPAGYSIVDLDKKPFAVSQETDPKLTLYEPVSAAIKDYSGLSYTQAFRTMFDRVRREYAFKDIPGKAPNWDALSAQLTPRVAAAERNHDPQAFFLALYDFTLAFKDGHVGLSGGQYANALFSEQAGAGYGFAIRELDDGHFVVTYVTKGGPAEKAGIVVGAEVTAFDDKPIGDAVKAVHNLPEPFSTDFALRYQQERYLLRAPEGTQARVTYQNPGQSSAIATLTSVAETDSFDSTSIYRDYDPNALPVEYHLLGQGVGYVKINTNSDDLNLIYRLFERALQVFKKNQVQGLIVDLRVNPGGSPLGLAGYLTDKTITLGQLQYFSEKTGKFENNDLPELYEPFEHQYRFAKMAVMVDQGCASACELEAYGFSKVPGMIVVGQYPSAGVEAEVGRGQYKLPEGLSLQVPTGRFVLPDGSIFLEGKGVVPTLRVPINRDTVLSDQDTVLKAAAQAVMP